MDLTRLRLLRELAHRGTMTAVGVARGLTSSAVSQQLTTLERHLGTRILERIGRRVRLTPEGERLLVHAKEILHAVELAEADLRGGNTKPSGILEIACFPSFAKARLLPAILRMRTRFPDAGVVIRELETLDAIAALREGRCHVAVVFSYNLVPVPEIARLVSFPLVEEPMLLALPSAWARKRGKVNLKQLSQEDWIVDSRQSDDQLLAERACALAGFAPRVTHSVDDYDLVLRMVAAGLGVGFVPESAFAISKVKSVVRRTPGGVALKRSVRALTRKGLSTSPTVRALISELDGPH
jgi:DNA-binding transcriptional LysR family regulator